MHCVCMCLCVVMYVCIVRIYFMCCYVCAHVSMLFYVCVYVCALSSGCMKLCYVCVICFVSVSYVCVYGKKERCVDDDDVCMFLCVNMRCMLMAVYVRMRRWPLQASSAVHPGKQCHTTNNAQQRS